MQINGRDIPKDVLVELVKKIKAKKELGVVDQDIVLREIKRYLGRNSKVIDLLLKEKRVAKQAIQKNVRAELHRLYGNYSEDYTIRKKKFKKFILEPTKEKILEILQTHRSTAERISIYEKLYLELFNITTNPSSILDLGCGMNPLSFVFMNLESVRYHAADISKPDLELIQSFFDSNDLIDGTTEMINLFDIKSKKIFEDMDKFDVCFLFKVLEIVEQSKSHKISENIIRQVPAKRVIVSFPKKTISGRPMRHPRRGWIERMLQRLCLRYDIISFENEVFYVIDKNTPKDL